MKAAVFYEKLKKDKHSMLLIAVMALFIFLLYMRDVGGMSVNKYLFLLLTAAASFLLPIDKVMYLIAFVMPLYVGLPGNFMTIIFLLRFLLDCKDLKMNPLNFLFCMLAGAYVVGHSLATHHTAISELCFFPGMILVMFMFSLDAKIDKKNLILAYTIGTAVLGVIMLMHTLQFYDFKDLLESTSRLGVALNIETEHEIMMLNADPNYYGMFTIAAISCGIQYLNESVAKPGEGLTRTLIMVTMGVCITIAMIGLSRAFILVLLAWLLLYLLSIKNFNAFFITACATVLAGVLVMRFIPDVWNAIGDRFNDSSMATASGRTELVAEFFVMWKESAFTMFFGTGIFDCNVHCFPLQILYGGGIVFLILYGLYMVTLLSNRPLENRRGIMQTALPLLVTLISSCSVPALALVNIKFPLAFVCLCIKENHYEKKI